MVISSSVYDSSPSGNDLTFTFSTIQNGTPLDYIDVVFIFRLYDARIDLVGDVNEDIGQQITILDSPSFPQYFLIEEGEQTVTVVVPWEILENYETGFKGDTHGSLQAEVPTAAQSQTFYDYYDEGGATDITPNSKGYTLPQLKKIKAEDTNKLNNIMDRGLAKAEELRKIALQESYQGGGDGEGDRASTKCWEFFDTIHICHPSNEQGNFRIVSWTPLGVSPAPNFNCEADKLQLVLHMVGSAAAPCPSYDGQTDGYTLLQLRTYDTQQAEQGSPLNVYGWDPDIELRNPIGFVGRSLSTVFNAGPTYADIRFEVPVRSSSTGVPSPIFLTLDVGNGGDTCRSNPDAQCDCTCRLFMGGTLSSQQFLTWRVPSCKAYPLAHFEREGWDVADCARRKYTNTLCNYEEGWPIMNDTQFIFKNQPNALIGGLNHHGRILGNDNPNHEPPRPFIYTTENLATLGADIGESSPYISCGVSYQIWLRFEEITHLVP